MITEDVIAVCKSSSSGNHHPSGDLALSFIIFKEITENYKSREFSLKKKKDFYFSLSTTILQISVFQPLFLFTVF